MTIEAVAAAAVRLWPRQTAITMTAIAGAESGYSADARGDNLDVFLEDTRELYRPFACDDFTSFGAWQINQRWWADALEAATRSDDPCVWRDWLFGLANNASIADTVLTTQGLDAWTVYRTGAYERFLADATAAVDGTIGVALPPPPSEPTPGDIAAAELVLRYEPDCNRAAYLVARAAAVSGYDDGLRFGLRSDLSESVQSWCSPSFCDDYLAAGRWALTSCGYADIIRDYMGNPLATNCDMHTWFMDPANSLLYITTIVERHNVGPWAPWVPYPDHRPWLPVARAAVERVTGVPCPVTGLPAPPPSAPGPPVEGIAELPWPPVEPPLEEVAPPLDLVTPP